MEEKVVEDFGEEIIAQLKRLIEMIKQKANKNEEECPITSFN